MPITRSRRFRPAARVLAALALSLSCRFPAHAALPVSSADQLCPPSVDPCVVARDVEVADGAALDLGLRTLRVEGGGQLRFAAGNATIACGRLDVATTGTALRAGASPDGGGLSSGGQVTLLARRACSAPPHAPCLVQGDCTDGECTAGDGTATIDGAVAASADVPGRVVVRAAGDVALLRPAAISSTWSSGDGGSLELESTQGAVRVAAIVEAAGGVAGGGGSVDLLAARDVLVEAPVLATGGDYDGGWVTVVAGRDAIVRDDVVVDSVAGAGFGGEVEVEAMRDIVVAGGGPARPLRVSADGHQSVENIGGDGGTVSLDAGRDVTVSRYARLQTTGAPPDGFADVITIAAAGSISFDGSASARARGAAGGGGIVELMADGDVVASSSAVFDVAGAAIGGDVLVEAGGSVDVAAAIDAEAASDGVGGRVLAVAGDDATVHGAWSTAGIASRHSVPGFVVEGCAVRIGASLQNGAASGRNRVVARGALAVEPGARLVASGAGGTNDFVTLDGTVVPAVEGEVVPAATWTHDAGLGACDACGALGGTDGTVCDDGDACTKDERCEAGACVAFAPPSLQGVVLDVRAADDDGGVSIAWKGTAPGLSWTPDHGGLRFTIRNGDGSVLHEETLPAGAFVAGRRAWRYSRGEPPAASGSLSRAILRRAGDPASLRVRVRVDGIRREAATGAGLRAGGTGTQAAAGPAARQPRAAAPLAGDTGMSVGIAVDPIAGEWAACAGSGLLDCSTSRRGESCASPP